VTTPGTHCRALWKGGPREAEVSTTEGPTTVQLTGEGATREAEGPTTVQLT
jgi:hypothetical protein